MRTLVRAGSDPGSEILDATYHERLAGALLSFNQDGGIAWLGTHILLIVAALLLEKHKKLVLFPKY